MFAHLGGYVGAMLPRLGPLLDHVVGDVGPSGTPRGDLGLCCFHDFTFIPKILLEKALPSGLRGTHSIFATLFLKTPAQPQPISLVGIKLCEINVKKCDWKI